MGGGAGSDSGGGSRGASFGGLGMRAIFSPFVTSWSFRMMRTAAFSAALIFGGLRRPFGAVLFGYPENAVARSPAANEPRPFPPTFHQCVQAELPLGSDLTVTR